MSLMLLRLHREKKLVPQWKQPLGVAKKKKKETLPSGSASTKTTLRHFCCIINRTSISERLIKMLMKRKKVYLLLPVRTKPNIKWPKVKRTYRKKKNKVNFFLKYANDFEKKKSNYQSQLSFYKRISFLEDGLSVFWTASLASVIDEVLWSRVIDMPLWLVNSNQ